jgi:hypothetical protein
VIAVIRKGINFGHAAACLFGPGERGEQVDAHAVAGDSVLLGGRDWVADMRFCARLRQGVSRPVWHCSLRAAPRDPLLGDRGWAADRDARTGLSIVDKHARSAAVGRRR